jgi:hypothetical protein
VGTAFFPLDEALGLLPGQCTPRLYEGLVLLGTVLPFGQAVSALARLLGVQISKASIVRATEAAGAAEVARQMAEVAHLEQTAPPAPAGAPRMVVSADGAMVPLRGGEWGEVRTLAVGVVPVSPASNQTASNQAESNQAPSNQASSGGTLRRTEAISYFSRLATAEAFTRQALVETHRRGIEQAGQVAAVMDGADWLQGLADHHCPRALRILDFAHAAQRIAAIAQTLWQEGTPQAVGWTTQWTHRLKHEGPQPLLAELRQLRAQHPDCEPLRINYAYLAKREAQLQYPDFVRQGWPIGSGMVESANKSVVEVRLKGAGMHWLRTHVDPMLSLRNLICNHRWQQEWPQVHAQLLAQAQAQRIHPCRQRLLERRSRQLDATLAAQRSQFAALHPEWSTDAPDTPDAPDAPLPLPKPKTTKPAHDHPWRRPLFASPNYKQNPKK